MGYGRYNQATLGPRGMRNNLLPNAFRIAAPTLFLRPARTIPSSTRPARGPRSR